MLLFYFCNSAKITPRLQFQRFIFVSFCPKEFVLYFRFMVIICKTVTILQNILLGHLEPNTALRSQRNRGVTHSTRPWKAHCVVFSVLTAGDVKHIASSLNVKPYFQSNTKDGGRMFKQRWNRRTNYAFKTLAGDASAKRSPFLSRPEHVPLR